MTVIVQETDVGHMTAVGAVLMARSLHTNYWLLIRGYWSVDTRKKIKIILVLV